MNLRRIRIWEWNCQKLLTCILSSRILKKLKFVIKCVIEKIINVYSIVKDFEKTESTNYKCKLGCPLLLQRIVCYL